MPPVTVAAATFSDQMARKRPEIWGNGTERIAEACDFVTGDDFFVARATNRSSRDTYDGEFLFSPARHPQY